MDNPTKPTVLYHGTSEAVARKALTDGLKPRRMTKSKGNWAHSIDSNKTTVYLTTTYAGYYAFCASDVEKREKIAILEIDVSKLDESKFLPDEDFVEMALRDQMQDAEPKMFSDMKKRVAHARDTLTRYRDSWTESLQFLGNCCYEGAIPPEAIKRVAIFDPESNQHIMFMIVDASVTPMNHKFCGRNHRGIVKWLFGESVDAYEISAIGDAAKAGLAMATETLRRLEEVLQYGSREVLEREGEKFVTKFQSNSALDHDVVRHALSIHPQNMETDRAE